MWPLARCISSYIVRTPSSQLGVLQSLRGSFQPVLSHLFTSLAHTSGGIQSDIATCPSPTKAAQVRHKGVNPFTSKVWQILPWSRQACISWTPRQLSASCPTHIYWLLGLASCVTIHFTMRCASLSLTHSMVSTSLSPYPQLKTCRDAAYSSLFSLNQALDDTVFPTSPSSLHARILSNASTQVHWALRIGMLVIQCECRAFPLW